jgi:monothiol glutaredoxin
MQQTEGKSMEVQERIRNELNRAPVVLFMKGTPDFPQCGFSAQTAGALRKLGVGFHSVNIFDDAEMREALKKQSNWPTYPQLYVKGELLGGCDIAMEMFRSGELRKVLETAGVIGTAAA